jgi:serine/threonine-protein kinase
MTRRLQDSAAVVLEGTEGTSTFFFSPDSKSVAFVADGKLKRMSLDGGAATTICDTPSVSPRGGTWGEDQTIVLASLAGGLGRVAAEGGSLERISQLREGEFTQRWPQYLPGAKAVLFTSHVYPDWFDRARIDVLSLVSGERKTLQTDASFGRFATAPDGTGYLTFVRAGALFAVSFDLSTLTTVGSPFPITDHVSYSPLVGAADFDISRTGVMIFRRDVPARLQWLDPARDAEPLLPGSGHYSEPIFSNDGEQIAFSIRENVWVYDVARRMETQITKGVAAAGPLWTPDDQFIVFSTNDNIAWVGSDGGTAPRHLLPADPSVVRYPTSIISVGDRLLRLAFMQLDIGSTRSWDLWTVQVAVEGAALRASAAEPYLRTAADERQLALSPDGRWVAYNSNESGVQHEIYVRAFPDDGRRWRVSVGGGMVPQWSPRRHVMLFQAPTRHLMAVPYSASTARFVPGAPRPWSTAAVQSDMLRVYTVRSDGRTAALRKEPQAEQQAEHLVELWTNVIAEFERRSTGLRAK